MDKIRVILPQKYDLVVGDTFQLFYRGIVEAAYPFCFDILAVCEKGKNFPRYFEFLPEEAGNYKLTISVYSHDKKLLGQGETMLCAVDPKEPEEPLHILCVGASITAGGQWPGEAHRRLTSSAGKPLGLGLRNISFIGTCEKDGVRFEGYGGWQWDSYLSTAEEAVWVVCEHDKTAEDQHSLWQDEQGGVWKLETLEKGYLKFIRYHRHKRDMPACGCLTHLKNAVHTTRIVIDSTTPEKESPFYDKRTQRIDFLSYCERNRFSRIDAVYVMLGANGLWEAYAAGISLSEHCRKVVASGKEFVRLVRLAYPQAKIRIMGLTGPSVNGGMGANYGAELPYCDSYGFIRYVMELNRAYQNWVLEPEYCDFMDFINVSGQFDADYSLPCAEKNVNTRSKFKELIGTNGLHPTEEGYMQIADAAFRNMVHLCREDKKF